MDAVYHFPVDNEAAVCGFEAKYENGTIVKGVVKEKEAAKQEYKAAKSRGRQANLLESVRRDVFTLSVGNLAPGAYIKIKIVYVTTLEARDDAAAFVLPTSIAPRYIPASTPVSETEAQALAPPESTIKLFGLGIRVETTCNSPILSIDSPTHASDLSVVQESPNAWEFTIKDIALDRDMVVLIKESESHQPRAVVELSDDGTMTGLVTFFPEIEFTDLQREFVFVVDRSGSMGGQKIAQARDALLLFLRSLPVSCTFNIIGFGSRYQSLFDGPVPYNDKNLEEASRFVAAMSADLGGTEVLSPLRDILGRTTPAGVERQVFVLTDGQVSNDEQVFELIRHHCQAEARNCRLFSVGIGQGVSRHLVSGMARAGRGTHRFVEDTSEDALRVKVLGQLKQAQQPALENVSIEWNFPNDEKVGVPSVEEAPVKTLLGFRSPSVDTAATSKLQPTMYPSLAPPIFNREKYLIYGMFPPGSTKPESVTVKCEAADGPLEVHSVISEEEIFHGSTARKLAARAAISEYEDVTKHRGLTATSKDEALQLALRNSLASSQTSIIAVSEEWSVDPGSPGETIVIPQQACWPSHHRAGIQEYRKQKRAVHTRKECKRKRVSRKSCLELDQEDLALIRETPAGCDGGLNWMRAAVGAEKSSDLGSSDQFLELTSTVTGKDQLWELCLSQKADGSFMLGASFERATGLTKLVADALLDLIGSTPSDIFATMLAIAVLRVKFSKKRNIWELQEGKALTFLRKNGKVPNEQLSKLEAEIHQMKKVAP